DPYRRVGTIIAERGAGDSPAAAATQASVATDSRVVFDSLAGAGIADTDRRVAFWLTGVAALVLVIGLANACTLLLVRPSRRRRDFAIRAALGASRARLLRHAFGEAALLSVAATAASLLLASWFAGPVRGLLPPGVGA